MTSKPVRVRVRTTHPSFGVAKPRVHASKHTSHFQTWSLANRIYYGDARHDIAPVPAKLPRKGVVWTVRGDAVARES